MGVPELVTFSPANEYLLFQNGQFPGAEKQFKDPAFESVVDFKAFAEQANSPNLKVFPGVPVQLEYLKIINDEAEMAWNLKKTPEEAMKSAAQKAKNLK